jgi:hypothetical protein
MTLIVVFSLDIAALVACIGCRCTLLTVVLVLRGVNIPGLTTYLCMFYL